MRINFCCLSPILWHLVIGHPGKLIRFISGSCSNCFKQKMPENFNNPEGCSLPLLGMHIPPSGLSSLQQLSWVTWEPQCDNHCQVLLKSPETRFLKYWGFEQTAHKVLDIDEVLQCSKNVWSSWSCTDVLKNIYKNQYLVEQVSHRKPDPCPASSCRAIL